MAIVAVSAQATRIDAADAIGTEWTGIGGGAGPSAETDYSYQGGTCISRKGTSGERGIQFTGGVNTDFSTGTGTYQTWMCKYICTTPRLLDSQATQGLALRVGSSSSAYHQYDVAGNDNYPVKESWLIAAINPNIASIRSSTSGSPTLTAINYFALIIDQSAVSKAENYALDSIDYGEGLTLIGGDGGDADGVWSDFVADDEGDATNGRWGFIHTKEGILYCLGHFQIGSATATVFTDSQQTIVFSDGLFANGFSGVGVDLQSATTAVLMTSIVILSRGNSTGEDTRPDLIVSGTSGTFDLVTSSLDNFYRIELTSSCTIDTSIISNSGEVVCVGAADLNNSSILTSAVAANLSALEWEPTTDPDGLLDNMTFSKGSAAHHAIEFGVSSPLTMTLRGMTTIGFNASNANNDSTFHIKRTTGTVTINIVGGNGNFSYRTDGAVVNIVIDPVTSTFTVLDNNKVALQNARVLVTAADGTGDLPYQDSITITRSGSVASVTHTAHGMVDNNYVVISGSSQTEYNGSHQITNVTTNTYDYTVTGTPTTPATGTIIGTGVVVSGLTDVSGQIADTRTWTQAQPITGSIRKSGSSPFFKTSDITGSISNTSGISTTNVMLLDE